MMTFDSGARGSRPCISISTSTANYLQSEEKQRPFSEIAINKIIEYFCPDNRDIQMEMKRKKEKGKKMKFRCGESNPDLLGLGSENERC